ncbi:EF-hand domain-containing protein [Erythrobacter sp. YT30]|uniref:EF-hand domain-containing protein n=1 Tax=Erythrobacter sp. YT30 TaxID=1735012 RepID=UPI0018D22EC8|nr:hypothetical protein [Erythrobacter sp. YT30]
MSSATLAQDGFTTPVSEVLLDQMRNNVHLEEYIANALRPLRSMDKDGDGLTKADVEQQEAVAKANERARLAQQFLRMDFNGDLKVDRAEILKFTPGEKEVAARVADRFIDQYDQDNDGTATLEEALTYTTPSYGRRRSTGGADLLALDPNGDGRITPAELKGLAEAAFDYFDSDGNGTLSREEALAIQEERRLAEEVRKRREAGCFFRPPSAGARFIAYAPYGGQTISNVFVGSPDIETSIVDMTIEAGKEPLYLVFTSYDSVIWRFKGATDRVERVIAASFKSVHRRDSRTPHSTSAVGIIGLQKNKVRIANRDCIPDFADQREIDAGVPQQAMVALFGREPDVIKRENPIGTLSLPSIKFSRFSRKEKPEPLEGFDPVIWEDAIHFHPGGLAIIDESTVIAAEPVGEYEVLPNKFGLSNLVASGHLKFEGEAFHSRKFTLLKPIARWPAGMGGALSTAFVKPEGIPTPDGRLGHSCVLSEEDGAKANWERLCREKGSVSIPSAVDIERGSLKR